MAKITTRAELNVGTELLIDEPNRTYSLVEAGNLNAKDGCTWQALYSKFVDLWATATYQDSPFPMNALDALSGQYQVGIDAGGNPNGWAPANQATKDRLRDGGAEYYDDAGTLLMVDAGVVGLGSVSAGAQLYYQRDAADAPTNFVFDDQANQCVQVYGDAANGNFDKRAFFKAFCREQGKKYSDSVLADTGKTGTGAFIVNMLLSNEDDLKISDLDAEMGNAPYDAITVTYYGVDQNRLIGGVNYPFRVIIEGNNATLEQIYTKVQYLLRQDSDIDSGAGSVNGKTAALLLNFVGDELQTTQGVYVDNIQSADSNRIVFQDQNGVNRTNPFTAAGEMSFNAVMVGAGSSYRLMYADIDADGSGDGNTDDGDTDDYGQADAVTVLDATDAPITGEITAGTIPFTFDYDGDIAGGDAATDKAVVLVGIRPNSSKFAVATGVLTRSKAIKLALVAEADRAYI